MDDDFFATEGLCNTIAFLKDCSIFLCEFFCRRDLVDALGILLT